jgi:hypothetical protein
MQRPSPYQQVFEVHLHTICINKTSLEAKPAVHNASSKNLPGRNVCTSLTRVKRPMWLDVFERVHAASPLSRSLVCIVVFKDNRVNTWRRPFGSLSFFLTFFLLFPLVPLLSPLSNLPATSFLAADQAVGEPGLCCETLVSGSVMQLIPEASGATDGADVAPTNATNSGSIRMSDLKALRAPSTLPGLSRALQLCPPVLHKLIDLASAYV